MAAVGSLGLTLAPAVHADSDGFSGPYEITTPPPSGNWSTLTMDPADAFISEPVAPTLDTSGAPASVTLSVQEEAAGNDGYNFEIGIAAAAAGTVTFSWSTTSSDFFTLNEADYFTKTGMTLSDGTTTYVPLATGNGTSSGNDVSFGVTQGEIFGFRVSADYFGSESLTISSFSAPVPEPDTLSWMVAGATGLLLCRELRRRRRQECAVGLAG